MKSLVFVPRRPRRFDVLDWVMYDLFANVYITKVQTPNEKLKSQPDVSNMVSNFKVLKG
jgi:hypothetical protein